MAAAAVPAISLGAQYFMSRGKNRQIGQQIGAATTGLQRSGDELGRFAGTLGNQGTAFLGDAQKSFGRANTAFDQSQNYFAPILGGSRAAIDQTLAPERAQITDTYRGATRALDTSGVRGGSRDLATAELNRDRAGRLALLPGAARANAATGMAQLGQARAGAATQQAGVGGGLTGQSVQARGGAASAYGGLFGGNVRREESINAAGQESGGAIGRMIFDALKTSGKKGGAGGGGAGGPAFGPGAINTGSWTFGAP